MKSNGVAPIIIKLLTEEAEYANALRFINEIAFERHGCVPPPPPQILFAATIGPKVVGTISLDFGDESNILPLEKIYLFQQPLIPDRFRRSEIAQYGRWMADAKDISAALGYTVTIHALKQGKHYGLFEVKDSVARRIRNLGVELELLPGTELVLANVPEHGRAYYVTQPQPKLYVTTLERVRFALGAMAKPFIQSRKIVLDSVFAEKSQGECGCRTALFSQK